MEDQPERIEVLRRALLLLLDNIDYEAGNCRVNEMIGAVLPKEILRKAREAVKLVVNPDWAWQCNECGSDEYSCSVSELDIANLSCGNCGANEFHKVEPTKAAKP